MDPGEEALIRLEEHEKQCTERMSEIKRALGMMSMRLWWVLGTALTGLGLLAFEFLKRSN